MQHVGGLERSKPRVRERTISAVRLRWSWWMVATFAVLIGAIWLPRGLTLDRVVTPDEHIWLARSANFYYALAHGDLADTYQFIHPGVTVMWIGAIAYLWRYPSYPDEAPGQFWQWGDFLGRWLLEQGRQPLDMLVAGRALLVIAITLVLAVSFLSARRLFGIWPAALGFLLIAFNPFHISLSQLMHLDAMVSVLMLLSLLAFLNYLYRGRRRSDLVLAGVVAGLAWLTRSQTLFLIPFAGLLLLIELWSRWRAAGELSIREAGRTTLPFLTCCGIGLVTFVLLWPAMWVSPTSSVSGMFSIAVEWAQEGHDLPLFFDGAIHLGDPGAHFYAVTYLWRSTPFTLFGLGLAIVALALPRARLIRPSHRRPLLMLILFAVLFMVFMSFGAKKFDRYLLPAYAPLDLVAAAGWLAGVRALRSVPRLVARVIAPAIIALAIVGQAASAWSAHPYPYSYYNPLLGGVDGAYEVMMIGWGEGLDQAAAYLNAQPEAEQLTVSTRAWPSSFDYFFVGQTQAIRFDAEIDMQVILRWVSADYYVLYITEWQRQMIPPELMDFFTETEPVSVTRIHDMGFAYVYDLRNAPIPDFFLREHPCLIEWGEAIRFVGYTRPQEPLLPGGTSAMTFYLQDLIPREHDLTMVVRLLSEGGEELARDESVLSAPPSRTVWPVERQLAIPSSATAGAYHIELNFTDAATGTTLPATNVNTGESLGEGAILSCYEG